MNPTANYIENLLNVKDPCLNFVDCSQTTYKGRNVIMCTAIAELDTCPNCKSADDYIYNGFKVVHIPYISADESNPVIIKVKKHGIFCKNCELYSYPSTQIVDKYCHISNAVKRKIIVGLTKDHSMTSIAVQVMKQLDKKSREYKLLKRYWKLYMKKYKDLEGSKQFYDRCLKVPYTPAQIVDEGLKCNETLKNTYDFMQDFVYALADKDTKKINDLLDSNIGQYCEQLKTTIRTFRKNRRAVINGAKMSYSNGCLEGVNRKIKQIERTAYGYSNFTHLLKRIRLEQNIICFKKSTKQTCSV